MAVGVKPFQRPGRHGNPTGSYFLRHKGREVSLQTRDPSVALERARGLKRGTWKPSAGPGRALRVTDLDHAADPAEVVDRVLSGETPRPVAPPAPPPPEVPASPPPPPPPPPEVPEVLSPGPRGAWTEDATAAAASSPGEEAPGGDSPPPPPSPEADRILDLAAEGWVSGCRMVGAWIARRRGLKPNEGHGRGLEVIEAMTVACTKQVLATLLPQLGDVGPEWGMIGGGLCIMASQILGAEPAETGEGGRADEIRHAA